MRRHPCPPLRAFVPTVLAALVAAPPSVRAQCLVERLLPDEIASGDQLGDALAVSGVVAVAGASRLDFFGGSSGGAFVFRYADDGAGRTSWRPETRLLPDAGAPNDLFGAAVAVDAMAAPGETIVVGAYLDDHGGGNDAGSAYVFTSQLVGESSEWTRTAVLQANDAAAGDRFGQSVAVSGDVIAIGSPRHDTGGSNTGAVYIFRYTGSSWMYETTLQAPTPIAQDVFGSAVAMSGDVLIVGAPLNDHAGLNSGAAYAFEYDGVMWSAGEAIVADDAAAGDKFGEAVAVSGDLALVGAALDDDGAPNTGAAYVFRFDGAWGQERKLRAWDFAEDDRFGTAVAVWDGPQNDDLVVIGAPSADVAASADGAAYLLTFDGVDWIETAKLTATDGAANDQLGWSAAVGELFALAGANLADDDDVGANAGSVYIFTNGLEEFEDCNGNGEPDFCDLAGGAALDCNGNLRPDVCDIADGISDDENENGIPDECDDCNVNGMRDDLDIATGDSDDCNDNGVPDECEISIEQSGEQEYFCTEECDPDCNLNGIPDLCEIPVASGGTCTEECDADCNANGVPDSCDIADGTSEDLDEDGVPDECFADCDGNGTDDREDIEQGTWPDCNTNGVPDICDVDPDDPDGNMEVSLDLNGDGIPDECQDCNRNLIPDFFEIASNPQLDCNGNDVLDVCEIAPEEGEEDVFFCTAGCDPDCNENNVPDACDIDPDDPDGNGSISDDVNANLVPDECEDCNENGMIDSEDIAAETSPDCNANGVPDECEIPIENGEPGEFFCTEGCDPDCNANGVPDACDVDATDPDENGEISADCDANGVPDECDPDCDENEIPDVCDIAGDPNSDLNDNGILDVCEPDCNDNGLPDFLEILWELVEDVNKNGIPDECETCVGDVDDNGVVDFIDILEIINAWGPCPPPCPADVNADGVVDFGDVIALLPSWGICD